MEKNGLSLRDKFVLAAQQIAPGFEVKQKSQSKFMRFLNFFVRLWCPDFMTSYATAIGNTVYITDTLWLNPNLTSNATLLAHELQHVMDKKKIGAIAYAVLYLMPQMLFLLSLLSLGAIWGSWSWMWWLCCLAFLAPIPSPGRAWIEAKAYSVTLTTLEWCYGIQGGLSFEPMLPEVIEYFTSSNYYFSWPFPKHLERYFRKQRERVKNNNLTEVETLVHNFVHTEMVYKSPTNSN